MSADAPRSLIPVPAPVSVLDIAPVQSHGDIAVTIFKWRWVVLGFGLTLMVAAAAAMSLKPPLHSAVARILVVPDRGTALTGLDSTRSRDPNQVLQTEIEFFRSRAVLLAAARALLADAGTAAPVPEGEAEAVAASLRSDLLLAPVPNTTVIQATYFAPDVAEAERMLTLIVDHWLEQRAAAYSGSARLAAFFQQKTDQAAADLRDAEERLRVWQERNDVVAVDSQIGSQLGATADLEAELKRVEAAIKATSAQVDTLTRDVGALPPQAVTSREALPNPLVARLRADLATGEAALSDLRSSPIIERLRVDLTAAELAVGDTTGHPVVTRLRTDLLTAEMALAELRQRYTDQDRRVQEKLEHVGRLQNELQRAERLAHASAQERVEGLRRELAAAERHAEAMAQERIASLRGQLRAAEREGDVVGRQTVGPHPLREALDRELATARARLSSLTSQRDILREQVRHASSALGSFREKRIHAQRLAREVDVARDIFLQATRRLEDAGVAAELEKRQLTTVTVVERPHGRASRDGFKEAALVVLLGLFVGLGLGIAAAFTFEFFNPAIRTRRDVEVYLGLPVLATVPAVPARGLPRLPATASSHTEAG